MGRLMKKAGIIITLSLLVLAGCSSGTASGRATFTVGMECGYAPFNWIEPTGSNGGVEIAANQFCNGYDVEIAKRIADHLDRELVIQKTSWEGLILAVQSDQIDAIIAGMSPTNERRKEIDFTDNYNKGKYGVVVRKDGPYATATTVKDYAGMDFSAQMGTFHTELMDQLVGANPQLPMKDFPTMTVAVLSGELDGFLSESSSGRAITTANPDLIFRETMGQEGFQIRSDFTGSSIGMKKGNALKDEVNAALATISEEERDTLMEAAIASGAA